jgi:hypothetical protein
VSAIFLTLDEAETVSAVEEWEAASFSIGAADPGGARPDCAARFASATRLFASILAFCSTVRGL